MIPSTELEMCKGLLGMFQINGQNANDLATNGQIELFHAIVFSPSSRVQIITPTQYGKSRFIAMACVVRSCVLGRLIVVTSPTEEKASIIMRYYSSHLGDNPMFYTELEKNTKLERLRMEGSKDRIILQNHGGIFTLSAGVSKGIKAVEAAMGEGADDVISDESGLLPDDIESAIFRMIAGRKDALYCKIGNPFYLNHFRKTWLDPNYKKIFITYQQALREGRYTQEYIEEARSRPKFNVFYPSEDDPLQGFPTETEIDDKGYMRLLSDTEVAEAQEETVPFGEKRIGCDVAEGGGDFNLIVLRHANYARKVLKYQTADTMDMAAKIAQVIRSEDMLDQNSFIDAIGVGKGVFDRLIEQKWQVSEYKSSFQADDPVQFQNKRAEDYWRLRLWIKGGGKLEPDTGWQELNFIKYKVDIRGRLCIMPKEDMMRLGISSPNQADALAMTFSRKSVLNPRAKQEHEILKQFDFHKGKVNNKSGLRTPIK